MESMLRNTFLFLSKNRTANRTARRYGLRFGARRFVAGVQISEAVTAVRALNEQGIVVTLDHLGEFITTEEEAREATECCIRTLHEIASNGVNSHLSLKMTQLGLDLSQDLCLKHMRMILDIAKQHGNFVRIDMEDYAHNEVSIALFEQLRQEYGEAIGLVIQAYLYKSFDDINKLSHYHPNLRLVKGAYKESAEVAFPRKEDVDQNFMRIIQQHLLNGNYTAIATHDDRIINHVKQFVHKHGISNRQFEFQMLYGIRTQAQQQLAKEGYTMRVYVPYGDDWYGYFMRRLAERPANVLFVIKSMFKS